MKYRFKPLTSIMVAGLFAATYAEACYYAGTQATCATSGSPVDVFNWTGGTSQNVTADTDWIHVDSAGLAYKLPLNGNHWNGAGSLVGFCHGPAHFHDLSSHSVAVPDWSAGTISTYTFPEIWDGGGTTGSTCN